MEKISKNTIEIIYLLIIKDFSNLSLFLLIFIINIKLNLVYYYNLPQNNYNKYKKKTIIIFIKYLKVKNLNSKKKNKKYIIKTFLLK